MKGNAPQIAILDGHTVNPGDLSWEALEVLGEVDIYDRSPPEVVIKRLQGKQIAILNKTMLTAEQIAALPELEYVGLLSTGANAIDLEAAHARGITVTNVPNYSTDAVAQHTFALLFALTRAVAHHDRAVHAGRWRQSGDFCFWDTPQIELTGLTIGIVGFGNIGRSVARIAQAIGMRLVVASRRQVEASDGVTIAWRTLSELCAEADVVSLHCPLIPETARIIDERTIGSMQRHALLLNTARGGLVDERALADALNDGAIAGAALDVLTQEPPQPDNPLLMARNCIITPHIAWTTPVARKRLIEMAADNLKGYLLGERLHVV